MRKDIFKQCGESDIWRRNYEQKKFISRADCKKADWGDSHDCAGSLRDYLSGCELFGYSK